MKKRIPAAGEFLHGFLFGDVPPNLAEDCWLGPEIRYPGVEGTTIEEMWASAVAGRSGPGAQPGCLWQLHLGRGLAAIWRAIANRRTYRLLACNR